MKDTAIAPHETDVHTEHCCAIHGCKYGNDEGCTVLLDAKKQDYTQSYVCYDCLSDGIKNKEDMIKSLHPTYGSLDNQIIMYAKNQYGKSNSKDFTHTECLYKDLRFLIGEWTGMDYACTSNGDVRRCLISAFLNCEMNHVAKKDALAEMLGWRWGRGNGILSDRDPICVILGSLSITKGKWVYLPQKIKGINFKGLIWEKSLTFNQTSDTV